jgi:hypothetical protein
MSAPRTVNQPTVATLSVDEDDDQDTQVAEKSSSNGKEASSRAADIIAMIRNRKTSE